MNKELLCSNSQPTVNDVELIIKFNNGKVYATVGDYIIKNVDRFEDKTLVKLIMKGGDEINLTMSPTSSRLFFAGKISKRSADIIINCDKEVTNAL